MSILDQMQKEANIRKDFEHIINKYSLENESNTPDFILAGFLLECLKVFQMSTKARDKWYDVHLEPGNKYFEDDKEVSELEEITIGRNLRVCPFCGNLPYVIIKSKPPSHKNYYIECSCGIKSNTFLKPENLIKDWNKRDCENVAMER